MKTEQYLKRALRAFREENQTLEQFLAVLIRIKRIEEPVSASSLLTVLKLEHDANPLPEEIYDGVSRWIKINSSVAGTIGHSTNNVVNIPSPKHPANLNREFRKHKARVLNNRYVLIKVIDSSFIGTVYKAIDLRKQEADIPEPYVAIKILKRTFRAHQDWLTNYYNEVQKRQWLTHPNITKVLGLDRDASTVFIIMEYILGESLAHALNFDDLRQNLIRHGRLLPTINGMGEALAFAHKRGIIHGNFKPSKVLLTKDDEVKVFDFSIECDLSDIDAADPTLELESPLVETRIYASPEVLEYKSPDPRDDVYALACTTYELLTGLHPFNREISTVARNAGMKAKFHNSLERRQWKALRHALAFERNKRTTSVTQFLAEFSGSHAARTTSWLRYAAGIAAIAATAGIALNYHFSKLEQAQVAQLDNESLSNLATLQPLPNPDSDSD
ncbi:MAG: protein kinase, partial [Thiothrix sp.]